MSTPAANTSPTRPVALTVEQPKVGTTLVHTRPPGTAFKSQATARQNDVGPQASDGRGRRNGQPARRVSWRLMSASTLPGGGTVAASAPGSHDESCVRVSASCVTVVCPPAGEAAAHVCMAANTVAPSVAVAVSNTAIAHVNPPRSIGRNESATTIDASWSTVGCGSREPHTNDQSSTPSAIGGASERSPTCTAPLAVGRAPSSRARPTPLAYGAPNGTVAGSRPAADSRASPRPSMAASSYSM